MTRGLGHVILYNNAYILQLKETYKNIRIVGKSESRLSIKYFSRITKIFTI